jgi:hypothetical protein
LCLLPEDQLKDLQDSEVGAGSLPEYYHDWGGGNCGRHV